MMSRASLSGLPGGCGGGSAGLVSTGMILTSSTLLYGPGVNSNIQTSFKNSIINGFTSTQLQNELNNDYIKYGFSNYENWTYWSNIANNAITAELISRGVQRRVPLESEAIVAGQILNNILSHNSKLGSSSTSDELLIAKAIHYTRNKYNKYNGGDFPKHIDISKIGNSTEEDIYTWNSDVPAIYHQNSRLDIGENIKLVDKSGKMEVIYNASGDIVYDPRDIGTYNFAPSNSKEIGLLAPIVHMGLDVVPWSDWGNSENDTTKPSDRKDALYYAYTFFIR